MSFNYVESKKLLIRDRVFFQASIGVVHHSNDTLEYSLKVGKYKKNGWALQLDTDSPKSELTLNNDEVINLIDYLIEKREYFPSNFFSSSFSFEKLFSEFLLSPEKIDFFNFIIKNDILPNEFFLGLEHSKRIKALKEFDDMLSNSFLSENNWQTWFENNSWVLGSDIVRILDERHIDTRHIADYLVESFDGFLDIIEIKKPSDSLKFWHSGLDHGNYIPSLDLTKAITQTLNYIYEIESESNSKKFSESVDNISVVKPRCTLIFGRSNDWNSEQFKAYRILNSSYSNINIQTYDLVLKRAYNIIKKKD